MDVLKLWYSVGAWSDRVRKEALFILLAFILFGGIALPHTVRAAGLHFPPPGFSLMYQQYGVEVYRKDYLNGNPDFVQVVHLNLRAKVRFYHAAIVQPRVDKGVYGGADPRFESRLLDQFWHEVSKSEPNLFCMTNGAFFYMAEYPTRLAFPLKIDGQYVTDGFGYKTYEGEKLMLEIWSDRAEISPFSPERFYASSAPHIIVGLSETANKRAKYAVGRTFLGIVDENLDGVNETILIFNTLTATQQAAAEVLRTFGATAVIMLDGGGSTQLICAGEHLISSERHIPQVIGVIAGGLPPISAEWLDLPEVFHVTAGGLLKVEGRLHNNGVLAWMPNKTRLAMAKSHWAGQRWYDFAQTVAPGESLPFSFTITPPALPGEHMLRLDWFFEYNGERFWLEPMRLRVFVQPLAPSREYEKAFDDPNIASQEVEGDQVAMHLNALSPGVFSAKVMDEALNPSLSLWWLPTIAIPLGCMVLFFSLRLRWRNG